MKSNLRNEIKSYIVRQGMTMQEVVDLLSDEYGWSDSVYSNPTELTAELLNTLIEKIVIHEATTVDGMREQNIDIYYRFIGKIE